MKSVRRKRYQYTVTAESDILYGRKGEGVSWQNEHLCSQGPLTARGWGALPERVLSPILGQELRVWV